jgi:hypothetical protein
MPDSAWTTVQEIAHRHGVLVGLVLNQKAGQTNSAYQEAVYRLGTTYPRAAVAAWFGLSLSGLYGIVSRYRSRHGIAAPKGKPEGSGRKRKAVPAAKPVKAGRASRLSIPLDQVRRIVALGLEGRELGLTYEELVPYCGVGSATICKYLNLWRGGQLGVLPDIKALGLLQVCADIAAHADAKKARVWNAPEPREGGEGQHLAGDKRFVTALMAHGGYPDQARFWTSGEVRA